MSEIDTAVIPVCVDLLLSISDWLKMATLNRRRLRVLLLLLVLYYTTLPYPTLHAPMGHGPWAIARSFLNRVRASIKLVRPHAVQNNKLYDMCPSY